MDFSNTKISLKRSIWSYGKVQRALGVVYLHCYGVPQLRWGIIRNVYRKHGRVFCDYVSRHDFGIYSNLSTTMEDILGLWRAGISVNRIDFSVGMNWFKDREGKDVYHEFFQKPSSITPNVSRTLTFKAFDVHGIYKNLPLSDLREAAFAWLRPSPSVINTADAMINSSGVMPERSIAMIYRGTDKGSEIKPAKVDDYIQLIERIMQMDKTLADVTVQTDQEQIRERMLKHFGRKCRFFGELPVTRGTTVIH